MTDFSSPKATPKAVGKELPITKHQLLEIAVNMGYLLIRHGGEVYRVEEFVCRMGLAYGMKSMEVFAIQSSVIVTLVPMEGDALSQTRRIYDRSTDLDKIEKLNSLCRYICSNTPSYAEIEQELAQISQGSVYSFPVQLFAFGMISFSFTLFMGGCMQDALFSLVIGVMVKLVLKFLADVKSSDFMNNIVGGCLAASFALLGVRLGIAKNMDMVTIGILMNLVPGLALTNSLRDFISGDFVAGMIKMVEALFVATGIAVGVGIPMAIFL